MMGNPELLRTMVDPSGKIAAMQEQLRKDKGEWHAHRAILLSSILAASRMVMGLEGSMVKREATSRACVMPMLHFLMLDAAAHFPDDPEAEDEAFLAIVQDADALTNMAHELAQSSGIRMDDDLNIVQPPEH